jgi:hypothetical protein
VPAKTVLKVDFLERDFERDHLAEKSNRTKMGQKIHCAIGMSSFGDLGRFFKQPDALPGRAPQKNKNYIF